MWIRWAYPDGRLIPTAEERALIWAQQAQQQAEYAQQQAEYAQQQAEQTQQRLEQTVHNLRRLGMSIAQIAEVTGLDPEHIQLLAP